MSDLRLPEDNDWRLFTGRHPSPIDAHAVRASVAGKRVLITGAGGFIGSALTRAIACLNPGKLVLLDVGELGLHQLQCHLQAAAPELATEFVVGSIRDSTLLCEIFKVHQPQIIFHAAACKHVPLMEANPFTAASTNALGTKLLVETAVAAGAEQCILLSTDKAVDPNSIMGATKRIAELVLLSQSGGTQMKALRLGNVLGSSGSVVALFLDQISRGGPVTVSHPDATRYFLSIEEAVQHLLSVMPSGPGPAIFVPDMGKPHHIRDLAAFLIEGRAPSSHKPQIVFTGLRPGDKLSERVLSSAESIGDHTTHGLHRIEAVATEPRDLARCLEDMDHAVAERNLDRLLQAVQSAVPEYHPSDLLRNRLHAIREARRG